MAKRSVDDTRKPARGRPAAFQQADVDRLVAGTMPADEVEAILARHPSPELPTRRGAPAKLKPIELDATEVALLARSETPPDDLLDRFVRAGKQDQNRKRTIGDKVPRPTARPPKQSSR
jgi:hypothetical protein